MTILQYTQRCLVIFHLLVYALVAEAFVTSFFAYLMYCSYRSREVTKEMNNKLYKYAKIYVLGFWLLFDIFVVGYMTLELIHINTLSYQMATVLLLLDQNIKLQDYLMLLLMSMKSLKLYYSWLISSTTTNSISCLR